ncbi:MAG: outer membrane lipoprotein-sorting protein [Lentisphaerae bacterium]|nr:outer membrane lipoprotein-sorting protein [Lentisphaerota bacterium]
MWPVLALAASDDLSPTEIIRRSDELLRGENSYSQMEMTISRPHWTRTVIMEGWSSGADNMFVRVLAPKKERGITFLKKGREAWNYIPAIDRVIKLPPSMMLQSWMGSDFTNDDVVRADSMVEDYTHRLLDKPIVEGAPCWTIEAIPKPDAPVVWGKVVFTVRQSNYVPIRVDFFDEDSCLVKFYVTSRIRKIEGRELATEFTMHDALKDEHKTSIVYNSITFKPELKPDTFSLKNLKQ